MADAVEHPPVSVSRAKLHLVEGVACRLGLVRFAVLDAPAEVGSAEEVQALEYHLCGLKEADELGWAAIDACPLVHQACGLVLLTVADWSARLEQVPVGGVLVKTIHLLLRLLLCQQVRSVEAQGLHCGGDLRLVVLRGRLDDLLWRRLLPQLLPLDALLHCPLRALRGLNNGYTLYYGSRGAVVTLQADELLPAAPAGLRRLLLHPLV